MRTRSSGTPSASRGRAGSSLRKAGPRSAEAVFVIGARGIIEGIDTAATELLGYAAHELVGQHGSQLVPPDGQPATAVTIDRMRRGELGTAIGQLVHRDGSIITVEVRSKPLEKRRIALLVRPLSG